MSIEPIADRPGQFRVRFDRLGWASLLRLLGRSVQVDPHRIALALRRVMGRSGARDAEGGLLAWNEYLVFLSSTDHHGMRDLEPLFRSQIGPVLEAEARRLKARPIGDWCVRLQVDHQQDLPQNRGEIHASFITTGDLRDPTDGEITVRFRPSMKLARRGAGRPDPTAGSRVPVRIRWPDGSATLEPGDRVTLGRPHDHPPAGHVALDGADQRINSEHLWIEYPLDFDGIYIGRLDGANPVKVRGKLLQAGTHSCIPLDKLPVRVGLSEGALVLRIGLER